MYVRRSAYVFIVGKEPDGCSGEPFQHILLAKVSQNKI